MTGAAIDPATSPADVVLIVGARSDIGQALAYAYARQGASLVLAARAAGSLEALRRDLTIRHEVPVDLVDFDLLAPAPEGLLDRLPTLPDTVILVAGLMAEDNGLAASPDVADAVMHTNFSGPARLLLATAQRMEVRGSGAIIGISSVAGERGRASNFVYGSAKAGLTAFLSGLRNALVRAGVQVITVKPGFVRTRMTADMDLPQRLTAEPEEVAAAILRAQRRGKDVIYVRPIWTAIMAIIRHLPERVFKRLNL